MEQYVDLDSLTLKTRRLEFEDGLNDFQNGFFFLILGGLVALFMSTKGITWYMQAMLFNQEITTIALLAIVPLLYLITFGIRRLIRRYRSRVLWRHLGEMEPFKWQVDRRINVIATLTFLVVVIGGVILLTRNAMDLDASMRVIAGAGGIATGVVYFGMGQSLSLSRYRWVGIIGGLLSGMLIIAPFNMSYSWLGLGVIWALTLSLSGAVALRSTLMRLREHTA
jgi:uncharacterized membrane protein